MNQLEQKTITSMEVAEMVEKDHKNVLADLRRYGKQFAELNIEPGDFFTESTYQDANNQTRPCYLVTKKGCEFISHKLTGVKGTEFTAKYINRFHDMEEVIQKPMSAMEQIKLLALGNMELEQKIDCIDKDLQEFKQDLPLLCVDMDEIKSSKNHKVVPMMGGKESNAYHDSSLRGKVYKDLESQIRREFGVSSYKAIKRSQVEHVKELIKNYSLPMCLQDEIDLANLQMNMEGI